MPRRTKKISEYDQYQRIGIDKVIQKQKINKRRKKITKLTNDNLNHVESRFISDLEKKQLQLNNVKDHGKYLKKKQKYKALIRRLLNENKKLKNENLILKAKCDDLQEERDDLKVDLKIVSEFCLRSINN